MTLLLGMIYNMDSRLRIGNLGNGNPIQSPQSFFLHVTCSTDVSKDFVYTPSGKPPASSVSYEKLEVLRKSE